MAISSALMSHQLQYHLVFGHLMVETFVSLAYKHLDPDHFVFKFLEPICADVGFVNRSWGVGLIADLPRPSGKSYHYPLSPALPFTTRGVLDAIKRGQSIVTAENFFCFHKGSYLQGGCGVKDSTPFEYRDISAKVFQTSIEFARCVVDKFWEDQDDKLAHWWESSCWEKTFLARCTLTCVPSTLAFSSTQSRLYIR